MIAIVFLMVARVLLNGFYDILKPLSHSHFGKYTENVSRDGLIFGSFTLPVIFRNLCVRSHTTRKDSVKTRDISCDVYNAPCTISLN